MLHACCHNPTGADLTAEQWKQVVESIRARGLIAFIEFIIYLTKTDEDFEQTYVVGRKPWF